MVIIDDNNSKKQSKMETITINKVKGEIKSELRKRVMIAEKQNPGSQIIIAPERPVSEAKMRNFDKAVNQANDTTELTKAQIEQMENYHRSINRNLMER